MSLQSDKVRIHGDKTFDRISVWKGREASREQLLGYHRSGDVTSPIDVVKRWQDICGNGPGRLFTATGSTTTESGELTGALMSMLELVGAHVAPDGKFTSHSLRIGANTEQVLLGIAHEARLARSGWKNTSGDMATL